MMLEVNAEEPVLSSLTTLINNSLLGKTDQISFNSTIKETDRKEYQFIQYPQEYELSLSAMINNAFLDKFHQISYNSTSLNQVKEQFIIIKPDEYNEKLIFEQKDKKVQALTTKVPFILPVPFP